MKAAPWIGRMSHLAACAIILLGSGCAKINQAGLQEGAALSPAPDQQEQQVRARIGSVGEPVAEHRSPEGFYGMAVAIPAQVEKEMREKKSWREGCPVPLGDLNYLVLTHWDFEGKARVGELVVHRKIAARTLQAFGDLYALHYPVERMELIEKYDANDDRSMEANNTSAFNCRDVTGRPGVFSNHSYGSAIDLNPLQNPYLTPKKDSLKAIGWDDKEDKADFLKRHGYPGEKAVIAWCDANPANCLIYPPLGVAYLARSAGVKGVLVPGPVVDAFASRGFDWGGAWPNPVDYQHIQVKPEQLKQMRGFAAAGNREQEMYSRDYEGNFKEDMR